MSKTLFLSKLDFLIKSYNPEDRVLVYLNLITLSIRTNLSVNYYVKLRLQVVWL